MNRSQWNALAADFQNEVCDIAREETNDRVKHFVRAGTSPGGVLVDMGCGVGSFIRKFGGPFGEIVGVEFAPKIIARAKQRCAKMSNVHWLTMEIPRAAAKIGRRSDFTVCLNVITQENEQRRAILWASLASVTKRGGHVLVVVPSLEAARMVERVANGGHRTVDSVIHADGLVERDDALQKHFTRAELDEIFIANGFTPKRIGRAHYPWNKEGMRETKSRRGHRPWDWICLAQRT
ncbi:MAG: class I SAM-dependent methyltransferase [Proteobacteria bacterium]|nr:class I SAM-dependent methyltransferase [Pseudomonadota bacterium]